MSNFLNCCCQPQPNRYDLNFDPIPSSQWGNHGSRSASKNKKRRNSSPSSSSNDDSDDDSNSPTSGSRTPRSGINSTENSRSYSTQNKNNKPGSDNDHGRKNQNQDSSQNDVNKKDADAAKKEAKEEEEARALQIAAEAAAAAKKKAEEEAAAAAAAAAKKKAEEEAAAAAKKAEEEAAAAKKKAEEEAAQQAAAAKAAAEADANSKEDEANEDVNEDDEPSLEASADDDQAKSKFKIVVLGCGCSAGYLCREIIECGTIPGNEICVVGDEIHLPYERAALSKAYLHHPGAKMRPRLPMFNCCVGGGYERQLQEWYDKHDITMKCGVRIKSIDSKEKKIISTDDVSISYETLVYSTGVRPAAPPQLKAGNVFEIRSVDDADLVVERMGSRENQKVVVIGGGYIGFEAAAAALGWTKNIASVTICFPSQTVMHAVMGDNTPLGEWIEKHFRMKGLQFRKGVRIKKLKKEKGGIVKHVEMDSGEKLECDFVILGIGCVPNSELLSAAGAETVPGGSIATDGYLRVQGFTEEQSVYAMGDIAAFDDGSGEHQRMEHVHHARLSAKYLGQLLSKKTDKPYQYLPFYYSRLFEYTEKPIIWNVWGRANCGELVHFAVKKKFGGVQKNIVVGFWCVGENEGKKDEKGKKDKTKGKLKIAGTILMGSPPPTPEQFEYVKKFVLIDLKFGNINEAKAMMRDEVIAKM